MARLRHQREAHERAQPQRPGAVTASAGARASRHGLVPWQVVFVGLAAIWGSNFWLVKVSLEDFTPVQLGFVRLALGACALGLLCGATGVRLPRDRSTWRHLFIASLLGNAIPVLLMAFGQSHITSALAGLINSTSPLMTLAVMIVAYPENRVTAERIGGMVLGFVGVLVIMGAWNGIGGGEWLGMGAVIGASLSGAIALPYIRRHLGLAGRSEGALSLATGQVACAAIATLPLAIIAGPPGHVEPGPIVATIVSGSLSVGFGFALYYRLIHEVGPSTASMVSYLLPVFAILAGTLFLGESLSWNEPVGGLVVLAGLAISERRLSAVLRAVVSSPTPGPLPDEELDEASLGREAARQGDAPMGGPEGATPTLYSREFEGRSE
jgi:drug/metabolite transporter (DMT)-like permease